MKPLNIRGCRFLQPKTVVDGRGTLSICESERDIPFEIKRCFWIHGVPDGEVRGHHAHRKSLQVHVCMSGKAEVTLDDGRAQEVITLNSPDSALLVGPMVWHSMRFSGNATFFVFTSDYYDASDYVRDFEEFTKLTA